MRALSLLSLALLVGVLTLFAMFAPVSERGLAPRPAEAAAKVLVSVNCQSNPETTRVVNNTGRSIKIRKVGSIFQPRSNEPFRVNRTLRPHRAITFESGSSANQNVLTRQFIYNNDVGRKEGARVATSIGRFVDRCG
jgi:hypothetical protein